MPRTKKPKSRQRLARIARRGVPTDLPDGLHEVELPLEYIRAAEAAVAAGEGENPDAIDRRLIEASETLRVFYLLRRASHAEGTPYGPPTPLGVLDHELWVVAQDGRAVAWFATVPLDPGFDIGGWVASDFRRAGIGRAFFKAMRSHYGLEGQSLDAASTREDGQRILETAAASSDLLHTPTTNERTTH